MRRNRTLRPLPPRPPRQARTVRTSISRTCCAREGSRTCVAMQEFFDAVRTRTGGQVSFEPSHFAELGGHPGTGNPYSHPPGPGRLDFGEVFTGDFFSYPNAVSLWEAFATPDDYSGVSDDLSAEMIRLVGQESEDLDLKVVGISFGSDLNLFSKQPISSLADFEGLRFRSPGGPVFDLLYESAGGMGSRATIHAITGHILGVGGRRPRRRSYLRLMCCQR